MLRPVLTLRRALMACAAGLVILASAVWARTPSTLPEAPTVQDRQITRAVTLLLTRNHLSRHALDDEMGQRCLKTFLKTIDPMKLYFYQSDVDGFQARENKIDDMLMQGDVSFAYDVFKVLLRRVDERLAIVNDLLRQEPDLSVDEEMIIDPDVATYPRTPDEAVDRWRKRIKYDLLVLKAEGKTWEDARDRLTRRYQGIAKRLHQTDRDELLEMYLTALTTSYDPHTNYMSPETLENFEIVMRLNLEGIGAALSFTDGYTVVNKIIPGGAADKDGRLKEKDRVIGVGQGDDGEIVDVVDMKLSDVVDMIRGHAGTVVRLQVIPDGQTVPVTYNITRAKIELKDSEARAQIVEQGKKADGSTYRVGVIDLPSFYMDMEGARQRLSDYKSTTRDVRKILEDFRAQGVDAVVMDLRRNGGGSLTEAIGLTGLFIDEGPVVQVKGADGQVQHYDDVESGVAWDGPLVVLISKLSASASEIFAGAIQDYRRGIIVGDQTTHGKGTVQTLRELSRELFAVSPNAPQLGALKITMQKFYRPNGDSTQKRGVVADVELPSITTHLDVGEADLDYAMEFDKVPSAPYQKLNLVDNAILAQLRDLSHQRCETSGEFQKELQKIARYQEQKQRKTVSLQEEKFLKERAELNAEKEEQKKLEEASGNSVKPVVSSDDPQMKEALSITTDYLRLVRVARVN
jgi:carboxyl-terminal processing protease